MALTNDMVLAERLKRFRSHGVTSTPSDMEHRPSSELWNYQQIDLGFNYRMTDIHAALGLSQMQRLDEFVDRRHSIAKLYDNELRDLPLTTPFQAVDTHSSYHLYPIRLVLEKLNLSHIEVHDHLQQLGINVNLHYIPVYRHPYYERLGFKQGYCPEAEKYHKDVLSIPIYPSLKEAEQTRVIQVLKELIG